MDDTEGTSTGPMYGSMKPAGGVRGYISTISHHNLNKQTAINKAKYGFTATKYCRKGKPHKRRFFIDGDDKQFLVWISNKKTFETSRIDLLQITRFDPGQNSANFLKRPSK